MKLVEFFNKPIEIKPKGQANNSLEDHQDELFWYIVDHDKLHKDYFFPIAKKVSKLKECGTPMVLELYMPMVNKGCKEFYHHHKLNGRLGKLFPIEMREEMCQRLHDHYKDDISAGKYKLG